MAIMNQLTYITLWYSTLQLIDGHYIIDRILAMRSCHNVRYEGEKVLQVFPVQISFHQTIWNILIPHQFNKQLTSRCVAIYHYFQMPSMTRQCDLCTTRERWREDLFSDHTMISEELFHTTHPSKQTSTL